jgi:hypothetical protein
MTEMTEIEELEYAINQLKARNETGNRDWENCIKWLTELLEIKKVK